MEVGDVIYQIRKEYNETQEQFAKRIGISRSYLGDIEKKRKSPSLDTIKKLAESLDVSLFYLTTGKKSVSDLIKDEKEYLDENPFSVKKAKDKQIKFVESNIKKKLSEIQQSELSFLEIAYLNDVLKFLKIANDDDLMDITALLSTLSDYREHQKNITDKNELKKIYKNELHDIQKLFTEFFNR